MSIYHSKKTLTTRKSCIHTTTLKKSILYFLFILHSKFSNQREQKQHAKPSIFWYLSKYFLLNLKRKMIIKKFKYIDFKKLLNTFISIFNYIKNRRLKKHTFICFVKKITCILLRNICCLFLWIKISTRCWKKAFLYGK